MQQGQKEPGKVWGALDSPMGHNKKSLGNSAPEDEEGGRVGDPAAGLQRKHELKKKLDQLTSLFLERIW